MADQERKDIKPVANGHVKEKGLADKAAEAFLSEDTKTVKNYILWDVIVPAVKNTVADVIIGGIEMILFGSSRGSRRSSRRGGETRVSYQNYYDTDNRGVSNNRMGYRDRDSRYSYDSILLDTRGEAEDVVSSMEELINKYGEATVADLCSLVGVTGKWTDSKWGWTDIRDLSYRRSGSGYILDFAKPTYLGS